MLCKCACFSCLDKSLSLILSFFWQFELSHFSGILIMKVSGQCYVPSHHSFIPDHMMRSFYKNSTAIRYNVSYKYNLRQGVDSLAQWLEHWISTPAVRVRIPSGFDFESHQGCGIFSSYASLLSYEFSYS